MSKHLPNKPQSNGSSKPLKPQPAKKPRPRDVWDMFAKKAERDGVDLDDLLWAVFQGMAIRAQTDVKAAHFVFDRLLGAVERSPSSATQVNLAVDASQKNEGAGPPKPAPAEFASRLKRLSELAAATELEIVDTTTVSEIDELLS